MGKNAGTHFRDVGGVSGGNRQARSANTAGGTHQYGARSTRCNIGLRIDFVS